MFNKIKKWFSDRDEVIFVKVKPTLSLSEDSQIMLTPSDKEKDISSLVYLIASKIRDNPKRLRFNKISSTDHTCGTSGFWREDFVSVLDTITNFEATLMIVKDFNHHPYEENFRFNLTTASFSLTRDEVDYLVQELRGYLEDYFQDRKHRLWGIRCSRKLRQGQLARNVMQKRGEES